MICNDPRCQDKSPHDWGDDGCVEPKFRCDICGHYFDDEKVVKTGDPYPHDQVFLCPECSNEDFTKMHSGFEVGDEVVVLTCNNEIHRGTLSSLNKNSREYIVEFEYTTNLILTDNIYSATKSGYSKIIERLESQRAALKDAIDLADDEIKKIEEEEKCQDR